jgi:hypothetical protein
MELAPLMKIQEMVYHPKINHTIDSVLNIIITEN